MTIRISFDELAGFDANLRTIKSNIAELSLVMDRVVNKIVYERIVTDMAVINDIENLSLEIKTLEEELANYIYDINLIKEEFKLIDEKIKNNSVELKNMIQDLLRKTSNSFIPATYSINPSILSEENENAMRVYGVDEKVNQTIELDQYNQSL